MKTYCQLYYSLKQRIYLAELRLERFEAMRLEHELDKHVHKCAECNGLKAESLASNLFGAPVFVKDER